MRVLTVADIHFPFSEDELKALEIANDICDVCFLLGDIPCSDLEVVKGIVSLPKIGILGNHDDFDNLDRMGISDAHGRICEVAGIKVAGICGSPRYNNEKRPFLTQGECSEVVAELLQQGVCDVLISHSGPYNRKANDAHRGFKAINRYMRIARPYYVLHGHDHEEHGATRRFLISVAGRKSTEVICTFRVQVHDLKL